MTALAERREMVVGIDSQHRSRPALAWAADEVHRRRLALQLLLAVPPSHDKRHADAASHHIEMRRRGAEALTSAVSWARERHGKLELTTDMLDGVPPRPAALSALPGDHGSPAVNGDPQPTP